MLLSRVLNRALYINYIALAIGPFIGPETHLSYLYMHVWTYHCSVMRRAPPFLPETWQAQTDPQHEYSAGQNSYAPTKGPIDKAI